MGLVLKVGEHRLPVEGGADVVQMLGEQRRPLGLALGVVEQIVVEQHLVGGGGHLRAEQGVVRVDERLRLVGVPAVHRVAGLVHQRKDVVQRAVEVEQHVGVHVVDAGGVGPAHLALPGIDVAPPLVAGAFDKFRVVLAQDGGGFQHQLVRLVEAVFAGAARHDGDKQVVHVAFLNPQHPVAQRDVPLEGGGVGPHGGQQVVVDFLGDKVCTERLVAGALVPAAFGDVDVGFHQRVVVGGDGVDVAAVGTQQLLKEGPAEVAVGACHRRAVGRVVDGEGVALPVGELLIAGVVDDEVAVDFIEGGVDVQHLRQHLLAALIQHMLLLGEQVVDLVGVEGKVGDLSAQRIEAFAGEAHQLRHQKGGALGGGAVLAEDGLIELFVAGVCHLGVVVAVGVGEQLCKAFAAPGV